MTAKYITYVPGRREELQFTDAEINLKRTLNANRGHGGSAEMLIWINVPQSQDYTLAIHIRPGSILPEYKELDEWIKTNVG
jgi:hypothetical protein